MLYIKPGEDGYWYMNTIPFTCYFTLHIYILIKLVRASRAGDTFMQFSMLLGFSLLFAVLVIGFAIRGTWLLFRKRQQIIDGNYRVSTTYAISICSSLLLTAFLGSTYANLDTRFNSGFTTSKYTLVFNDNSIIATDNNLIYLGRTSNYLFLFNKGNGTSEIYKTQDIKKTFIQDEQSKKLFNESK